MARVMTIAATFLALAFSPGPAAAGDICHQQGPTQYNDSLRTCVSSVLPEQGGRNYGPENLASDKPKAAWCEGVTGDGIGQTITLHQTPAGVIDSLIVVNGYARTSELYRANGRVRQARIVTSGGYEKTVNLMDNADRQEIRISPHQVTWIRLVILAVYPGARFNDTCLSTFQLGLE